MIVVLFLLQFVVSAASQAILVGLTDSFAGYAIADLVERLLIAPLSALAASVMFFELKAMRG